MDVSSLSSSNSTVSLRDAETGQEVKMLTQLGELGCSDLAFSPDGRTLAVALINMAIIADQMVRTVGHCLGPGGVEPARPLGPSLRRGVQPRWTSPRLGLHGRERMALGRRHGKGRPEPARTLPRGRDRGVQPRRPQTRHRRRNHAEALGRDADDPGTSRPSAKPGTWSNSSRPSRCRKTKSWPESVAIPPSASRFGSSLWTWPGMRSRRRSVPPSTPDKESTISVVEASSILTARSIGLTLEYGRLLKAGKRTWSRWPHRAVCDARAGFFHAPVSSSEAVRSWFSGDLKP